jgi:hypothetical protein
VEWRLLIEFVVAIGYGVLSSVVPIFNAEIYIVASQVGGFPRGGHAGGRLCGRTDRRQGWHRARSAPGPQFTSGAEGTRAPSQAGWSRSDKVASLVAGTPVSVGPPNTNHGRRWSYRPGERDGLEPAVAFCGVPLPD